MKLINKMGAECLGTFWLVLGGCGTAIFGHVGFLGVALAFGLTIVAMAYGIAPDSIDKRIVYVVIAVRKEFFQ